MNKKFKDMLKDIVQSIFAHEYGQLVEEETRREDNVQLDDQ